MRRWTSARLACVLLPALTLAAPDAAAREPRERGPEFCGPKMKHRVEQQEGDAIPAQPEAKARVYFFWRGSRARSWAGTHCKVALGGQYVGVLAKNTFGYVDVEPGSQKFCSAGAQQKVKSSSLQFVHAEPGAAYYLECSPGGDMMGQYQPTLVEVEPGLGQEMLGKMRYATFSEKQK